MGNSNKRDIFKKRKNKAYKNLVSYGQYGVVVASMMTALAGASVAQAEEQTAVATEVTITETESTVETEPSEVATSSEESVDHASDVTSTEDSSSNSEEATSSEVSSQETSESAATSETSPSEEASSSQASSESLSEEASNATTLEEASQAAQQAENLEPVVAQGATFSWQVVPNAADLLTNSVDLKAIGATITYVSQPVYGQNTASVLVTYADGTTKTVVVPVTVTANAVTKPKSVAVEDGTALRIATSPNTSGIVNATFNTQTAQTGLKIIDTVIQNVRLNISGESADYTGGYIEIVTDQATIVNINPSSLTGVTITNTKSNGKNILRFYPSNLKGGSDYLLTFSYSLSRTANNNQGESLIQILDDTDRVITTTATFYDKDGLVISDMGSHTHEFMEAFNAPVMNHGMANWQLVGLDTDRDGLVDEGASKIYLNVGTGVHLPRTGTSTQDLYAIGTGVFDGRFVGAVGNETGIGNAVVEPVTSYTYTVAKKAGFTLSEESKAIGWVETDTGYTFTVTPDNNYIGGDKTTNGWNSTSRYVPIIFDIVGANVTDIRGSQTFEVTAEYTKEDGDVYSHAARSTANMRVLETQPSQEGIIGLAHYLKPTSDSEIIRSYGRAYYDSRIELGNNAMVGSRYSLEDYHVVENTLSEDEYYRELSFNNASTLAQLEKGHQIHVYNNTTNQLIKTITKDNVRELVTIPEEDLVNSIRLEFDGMELYRSTDAADPSFTLLLYDVRTFFADWEDKYKDTNLTSLWSETEVNLVHTDSGNTLTRTNRTELVREVYITEMRDDNVVINQTSRGSVTGTIDHAYNLRKESGGSTQVINDQAISAITGTIYRAYLVSPELKLQTGREAYYDIYYNYNGSGKDLYVYKEGITTETVPQAGTGWIVPTYAVGVFTYADQFVPNGSYTIESIAFWETDPGLRPLDGINLGTVNGIEVTTANSATKITTVNLTASDVSGVLSKVKADEASSYGLNTNQHEPQDVIDFEISFRNISTSPLDTASVITSLPSPNDQLLMGGSRGSQFTVAMTGPAEVPAGWRAVYSTTEGTAAQIDAAGWLNEDQVTDWSTIRAVKFISTATIAPELTTRFYIPNAVIQGDATQGERGYLSSASSSSNGPYLESNRVLIGMKAEIPDGSVVVNYVNEAGEVIAPAKTVTNDIKSDYDVSDQATYYPAELTGTDGLPYELVEANAEGSAANTGQFTEETQTITHVYRLVPQTATFTFVDVTDTANPNQLGEVDSETGGSGQAIEYSAQERINAYLQQGYELVSNDYDEDTLFDTDKTVDQAFTIELKQRVVEVPTDAVTGNPETTDPNSPNWPVSYSDLETSQTISRAIIYRYIDASGEEAAETVIQTVTFNRKAYVNMVTGEVTYGPWDNEELTFPEVPSPTIPGYTASFPIYPSQTAVPDQTIGIGLVVYTPNEQVATVTYINETSGETLEVTNLTGVTDGAITYPENMTPAERIAYYESLGYELVSNDAPTDAVYDNIDGNSQDFTVVLREKVVPIDPTNPVNPKTDEALELTRTVTRTITYKYLDENGQEASATVTQTATFTRTATVNMVTGEVVYADWTSEDADLDAIDSPAIAGYTASQASVPAVTLTAEDSDSTVTVIYTPNEQVAKVTYVDQTTGQTLEVVDLVGQTDGAIDYNPSDRIAYYASLGYDLVSNNVPTDGVYDNIDGNSQDFTVVLREKVVPVDPTNPVNPKTDEALELTRTITYKYLDENGQEASATVTQTATFTRTAQVNMVTGEVVYADWTSEDADLDAVDSPAIAGYTASQASVPAVTLTAEDSDSTVTVIYTPNEQVATVTYIDETSGETLEVTNLTGVTDGAITYPENMTPAERIAYYESLGYELVSNDAPTDAVYDNIDDNSQDFQVVLVQRVVPIDPTNPVNPKTDEALELTRTVTRTITYKYLDENGQEASATVTQTATFTRTAQVNMVTGEVVYADWTSEDADLDAVDSPAIAGYTASQASVPAVTLTAEDSDSTVTVIYTPNEQVAKVTYIDETTGQTLEVVELVGQTDGVIDYNPSDRIAYYESLGYDLVSNNVPTDGVYDNIDGNSQDFTVVLREKVVPVDPTNPVNPKTDEALELTRTVTRTITYKYLDENGQEASATVTQTATFTRTAQVNMVTGEVVYADWTSEDADLEAVTSPAIAGYTPNLSEVPALTVSAEDEDTTVVVIYTPNVTPMPDPKPQPQPTPQPKSHTVKTDAKAEAKAQDGSEATLPETGEQSDWLLVVSGILMMLMGLVVVRKKSNED
ncbi:mucin-binding protein [Streptococcus merionis]|uniref:mucin-binding protein n=1 Tax=Streptococcus merionis TaxID=400065 RepID=UPI0035128094